MSYIVDALLLHIRAVDLPEFECGTNDRWLYAAALLMLALVAAVGWVVWRVAR